MKDLSYESLFKDWMNSVWIVVNKVVWNIIVYIFWIGWYCCYDYVCWCDIYDIYNLLNSKPLQAVLANNLNSHMGEL